MWNVQKSSLGIIFGWRCGVRACVKSSKDSNVCIAGITQPSILKFSIKVKLKCVFFHVGQVWNVAKLQRFLSGQLMTVTSGFSTFFPTGRICSLLIHKFFQTKKSWECFKTLFKSVNASEGLRFKENHSLFHVWLGVSSKRIFFFIYIFLSFYNLIFYVNLSS